MKQLVAPGVSLILVQPHTTGFHTHEDYPVPLIGGHDPWATHAAGDPVFGVAMNHAGEFAAYFEVLLDDGHDYFYLAPMPTTHDAITTFYDGFYGFVVAGLDGFEIGESFNFVFRGQVYSKLTASQFFADWSAV